MSADFVDILAASIGASGLAPGLVTLEIPELKPPEKQGGGGTEVPVAPVDNGSKPLRTADRHQPVAVAPHQQRRAADRRRVDRGLEFRQQPHAERRGRGGAATVVVGEEAAACAAGVAARGARDDAAVSEAERGPQQRRRQRRT